MGFLSPSIESVINDFSERYGAWKKLYHELNKFAVAQFYKPQIENDDMRSLLIFSCYYRALTVYQAVYLLVERGNDTEGKSVLRNLVETAFVLRASINDAAFAKRYIRLDEKRRIQFYEDGIKLHEENKAAKQPTFLTDEKANEMRKAVADYKKKAADTKSALHISKADKQWNIKKIAEAAGLAHFYKKEYAHLCKYTHPSPYGMRDYLITDAAGKIASFKIGPRDEDAEADMRLAIVMMIVILGSAGRYYGLAIETELQAFKDKLDVVIANSLTQIKELP